MRLEWLSPQAKDWPHNQKLREGHGIVFGLQNQPINPTVTLILDFWTPELWENKFLSFQATPFVAICYGRPRKLMPASTLWRGVPSEVTAANKTALLPSWSLCSSEAGETTNKSMIQWQVLFGARRKKYCKVEDGQMMVKRECLSESVLTQMNLDCGIAGCMWVTLHSST